MMNNSSTQNILKFSIGTWVNFGIGIVTSFLATRLIDPSTFAVFNIFSSNVTLIMFLVTFGLDSGFMRYFNEPPNGDHISIFTFKVIFIDTCILALFSIVGSVFFYKDISNYLFGFETRYLVIVFFVSVFSNIIIRYSSIIFKMSFNIKMFTVLIIIVNLANRALIILAILINDNLFFILTLQSLCILMISMIVMTSQRKLILPKKELVKSNAKWWLLSGYKDFFKYSITIMPAYFLTSFSVIMQQQIIKINMSLYYVGIYASTSIFLSLIGVLSSGFGTYWHSYVFMNYKNSQAYIIKMHDYIMILSTGLFLVILLFKDIIYLFIGQEYQSSNLFVSYIILASILMLIDQTTSYGVNIANKNHVTVGIQILQLFISFSLSIVLVKDYGLTAVAFAFLISKMISSLLIAYSSQKYYKSITSFSRYVISLLVLLVIAIVDIYLISSIIKKTIYLGLLILLIVRNRDKITKIINELYLLIRG